MSEPHFMVWKDEFSVGVEKLDAQHLRIFGIINDLYDAMKKGQQSHVLGKLLQVLLQYTETHFSDEESVMRDCRYPQLESHKEVHKELARKTRSIVAEHRRLPGDFSMDVFSFLKSWWTGHIMIMDRKYAPFVRGKDTADDGA